MLNRLGKTKEKLIILTLVILILLVAGIFVLNGYIARIKFEEQAVIAEKHLKAEEYEEAIQAYLKAMAMKNSDQERLSIGLAEAHVGVHNYDKALEVLRSSYQKTGGNAVKVKIEEVTAQKTDYEFNQIISHAETYFTNAEYEKAIIEFEKAKLIKSKEGISYQRIAEAYMAIGDYQMAKEELLEGLELTQTAELQQLLTEVVEYLAKLQYTEIVNAGSEYIFQENYEDGILKLKEAIELLPYEENAYSRLAEVYIFLNDYESAISLLTEALRNIKSSTLAEALDKAETLRDERTERDRILEGLYKAVKEVNIDEIIRYLNNTFFTMKIAGAEPVYYGLDGEGNRKTGNGMVVINKDTIYAGGFTAGIKKGTGVYFVQLEGEEAGWYYYQGEWSNNVPNGEGKFVEEQVVKGEDGSSHTHITLTEGTYQGGLEEEQLKKVYYIDGKENGRITYQANRGVPKPLSDVRPPEAEESDTYIIAEWTKNGETTGEFFSVKKGTVWGVKGYLKK